MELDTLRIVYYHEVPRAKVFKKQLQWLSKKYRIISLSEAIHMAESSQGFSNELVVTFDDGFSDLWHIGAGIMLDEKIPATFFLINNCLDNENFMWRTLLAYLDKTLSYKLKEKIIKQACEHYKLPFPGIFDSLKSWSKRVFPMYLKDEISELLYQSAFGHTSTHLLTQIQPYLNKDQVKALLNQGFEIGAHTKTHPLCNRLSESELKEEVVDAKEELEKIFQVKINSIAFPFGLKPDPQYIKYLKDENQFKCTLGIFNINENTSANTLSWQRDKVLNSLSFSQIYFNVAPYIFKVARNE